MYTNHLWIFNMHDDEKYKDPKLSDEELDILRKWYQYNSQVLMFQNKASLYTFEEVFGMEVAEHLFRCFRFKCNEDYQKFTTYLTADQKNDLYVHILRCPRYK
jgi:hypothetical protein